MEIKNIIWTEKYRPTNVESLLHSNTDFLKNILEEHDNISSLLLYSNSPGTGKTSFAKILVNEADTEYLMVDILDLNEHDYQNKLLDFVRAKSRYNRRKIVLIDNIDSTNKNIQSFISSLIDSYSKFVLFILSVNSLSKLKDTIKDNCLLVPFLDIPKEKIGDLMVDICIKEDINFTEEGIIGLVNYNYPSIRSCINCLHNIKLSNSSLTDDIRFVSKDIFLDLWSAVIEKGDRDYVVKHLLNNEINIRELNKFFWRRALEINNIRLIQITCDNEKLFIDGKDELVIFVTSLIEMVR